MPVPQPYMLDSCVEQQLDCREPLSLPQLGSWSMFDLLYQGEKCDPKKWDSPTLWAKNAIDMKSTTEPTSFPPNYQHYNCYALSSGSLQEKRPKFLNFPEKKRKFSTQVFLGRSENFRFLRNKGLVLSTLPSPGRAGGRRRG